jgi:hypothetical protein
VGQYSNHAITSLSDALSDALLNRVWLAATLHASSLQATS